MRDDQRSFTVMS